MQPTHHMFGRVCFFLLAGAILVLAAGCGDGNSGPKGDRHGDDTPSAVSHIDDVLGIQGSLYADPDGYVTLNYKVQDGQYDPVDVEIEYGWDEDGSGVIEESEFTPASPAPGSGPTKNLVTSPEGAGHTFIWASKDDIGTNRIVNQDYVYTVDGRREVDAFGDVIYEVKPGMVFRMSTVLPDGDRNWRLTSGFSISNNNPPEITKLTIADVTIPLEGLADGTVNEHVAIGYGVADNDRDSVTIAVDWVSVPKTFDPSTLTEDELDLLPWGWATYSTEVGDGTSGLSTMPVPGGVDHTYGWDSVSDAGTDNTGILVRMRPIDEKNEVGAWTYLDAPMSLDNFTVFNQVNDFTKGVPPNEVKVGLTGARSVVLTNGNVLVAGGIDDSGRPVRDATIFYPTKLSQTTTGNLAAASGSLNAARANHTMTRLYRTEDPADATKLLSAQVLVVGGEDVSGTALSSVEMFDPRTGTFSPATSMDTPRKGHVAVLLNSGKVFVAGGIDENGKVLDTAEIYDPNEPNGGKWTPVTGSTMTVERVGAQAAVLPGVEGAIDQDGLILIVGGKDGSKAAIATIEVYNAPAGEFENLGGSEHDLAFARYGMSVTATLETDHVVVVAGGMASDPKKSIELYSQENDDWTTSSAELSAGRAYHVSTLLGSGRILFAGGQTLESGTLDPTADIFDVTSGATGVMDTPNGELAVAVKDASVCVLQNGRTAIFGGTGENGRPVSAVQTYTPDSEATSGFNNPPTVEIRTPTKVEPWAFGVVIPFRVTDPEGDLVRATFQYKIKPSSDDTALWTTEMKEGYLDRWLQAGMQDKTVLGDRSSGTSGLTSRTDATNQAVNPIDNPDDPTSLSDAGEHQFVWKTASYDPLTEEDIVALQRGGIPKGDYDNVYVRVIVHGATEAGAKGVAATGSFAMTKNAPVIARIDPPIADASEGDKVYGNVVFPYYLQDSDPGNLARVVWEYGVDLSPYDGKIVEADGEAWVTATPLDSNLSVTYNGVTPAYSNPTDFFDLTTGVTGNEDADGIPWGVKHYFVWNSVADLGAPVTTFDNVIIRVTPYDYPAPPPVVAPENQSLGIAFERSDFTIDPDPNGLYLTAWSPTLHTTGNGTFQYTGVNTDEPIEFIFTAPVALSSVDEGSIQIYRQGTSTPIDFYPEISGNKITIWPQAQEIPARQDVLFAATAYDVMLPGFDPAEAGASIIQRAGYTTGLNNLNTNMRYLLHTASQSNAMYTGAGAMQEGVSPNFAASPLVSPSPATNVQTSTTLFQVKFTERLNANSVTHENFQVTINGYGSTHSVVPGKIELKNIVDGSGAYALLTYTLLGSTMFPPGATIDIVGLTGLRDLYGNPLGSVGVTSFGMVPTSPSSPTPDSWTESFDDTDNRDYDETTAWWGDNDPQDPGSFSGSGTDGSLTGLFSLGTSTQSMTVGSGQWRIDWDNTNKGVFELKDLTIQSGGTLYFRPKDDDTATNGNYPITLRVGGKLTIESNAYLDVSGSDGSDHYVTRTYGTLKSGGAGGAAGDAGGGAGKWVSPGSSIPANENGFGTGGGKRGTPYRYTSTSSYPYYGGGGGGGGHASAGTAGRGGYSSLTLPGAGGIAYGDGKFADPAKESGSGGGCASTITTDYSSYDGCFAGATGGGGGGSLQIITGELDLKGYILASGGDGGDGSYLRYTYSGSSTIYRYGGGGGGGSGGGVQVIALDMNLASTGRIDVSGGTGGNPGYTYSGSSYYNPGGPGSGGFVCFGAEGAALQGTAVKYVQNASTLVCTVKQTNGAYPDLTISSSIYLNPSTGKYGTTPTSQTVDVPGWQSDTKQFHVGDVDLQSGATVTLVGTSPLVVMAAGDVNIEGKIVANGEDTSPPVAHRYDYTGSSSSGWYHYDEYRTNYHQNSYSHSMPGKATGGGGNGGTRGTKRTYTNAYGWYHRPTSIPSGTAGGNATGSSASGGKGGAPGNSYSYSYTSGTYSYGYYYNYYGGAGGGGGSESAGKIGIQYKYYPSTYYYAKPGAGGSASITPASVRPDTVRGGGGGGGGCLGGYKYRYQSGSYTYQYYYNRGGGTAGGAGGGAVGICAKGTIHLAGEIELTGGDGGSCDQTSSSYSHHGAGGGGGGGNVVMFTETGYVFGVVTIECSAGIGGVVANSYYTGSRGGAGATGALKLMQKVGTPVLPPSAPTSNLILGTGGKFVMVPAVFKDTGVSTWQSTGRLLPEYRTATTGFTGTGINELLVQGAMADPAATDDSPDLETATEWLDATSATELAKLNGYMFFRFKAVLEAPGPNVTSVTVGWQYPD